MHLEKVLTVFGALSSGALSFKIRAFSVGGCTSSAREINVWDNTCRMMDVPKTRSFRVLAYGAGHQRATFWHEPLLRIPRCVSKDCWANRGSDAFIKDRCIMLRYELYAFGSHYA
ncbi:hypothetical protein BDV12DRAFT_164006 [Aspergillus spectabilis]